MVGGGWWAVGHQFGGWCVVGDGWWVVACGCVVGCGLWVVLMTGSSFDLCFQYLVHRQAWQLPELVWTVHQIYASLDVLHWVEFGGVTDKAFRMTDDGWRMADDGDAWLMCE